MNESQEKVLSDMLHDLELATRGDEYHQTITKDEFDNHVRSVKEMFGFDYFIHKDKIQKENEEKWQTQPTDRDATVHKAKQNH